MRRNALALIPLVLCATLWAASYRWALWVWRPTFCAAIENGALYVTATTDPTAKPYVEVWRTDREPWEGEFEAGGINRWLPLRALPRLTGDRLYVLALWVPTLPAALLAAWAWRRRRPTTGRGFDIAPAPPHAGGGA